MGKAKRKFSRKNPIAVALARLRAKRVPPERRREIARKAAAVRWARAKRPR